MKKKQIIINGHEAVDLGLSVKWATCNVDANNPDDLGEKYCWEKLNCLLRNQDSMMRKRSVLIMQ